MEEVTTYIIHIINKEGTNILTKPFSISLFKTRNVVAICTFAMFETSLKEKCLSGCSKKTLTTPITFRSNNSLKTSISFIKDLFNIYDSLFDLPAFLLGIFTIAKLMLKSMPQLLFYFFVFCLAPMSRGKPAVIQYSTSVTMGDGY